MPGFFGHLAKEPPFRFFVKKILNLWPVSVETRERWDLSSRPNYLAGVLAAAKEAATRNIPRILAVEFGVAGGNGLVALQEIADAVEKTTGVEIGVVGFDAGSGLPELCGDHRDHPDQWSEGMYEMDVDKLKSRLKNRTRLVLGNIAETIPEFVASQQDAPIGFVAFDVDLYSSTRDALRIFTHPDKQMLLRTYVYFDNLHNRCSHTWAGERLAIREFNEQSADVKVDRWHGLPSGRPFEAESWIDRMYIAHDLDAITNSPPCDKDDAWKLGLDSKK